LKNRSPITELITIDSSAKAVNPVDFYPKLPAPWYQWPGIDFIAENVVPFHLRDRHSLHFDLPEARPMRHDAIRSRAVELQQMGAAITPPPGTEPGL
jgi:hypothetical protein